MITEKTIATYRATKVPNGAVKVFLDTDRYVNVKGLQKLVRETILADKTLNMQETYEIEGTVEIKYNSPYGETQ